MAEMVQHQFKMVQIYTIPISMPMIEAIVLKNAYDCNDHIYNLCILCLLTGICEILQHSQKMHMVQVDKQRYTIPVLLSLIEMMENVDD